MCTLLNEQSGYARTVRSQAGTSGTRSVAAVTVERDTLRQQVAESRLCPQDPGAGGVTMPGIEFNARMIRRGPMFNGKTAAALHTYADEVGYKVATFAEDQVQQRLAQVLQHPTGYYQSKITVERAGTGYRVTDQGVVYGPWLEGTGSRNAPVTRFAGYSDVPPHEGPRGPPRRADRVRTADRYKAMGLI
jgi:hypothetical protein